MDKHIFSQWQVALCALFVLADGLYLPAGSTHWLALLCGAALSAALLLLLGKLPGTLLDLVSAVLALLLPLRSLFRLYPFWDYAGLPPLLAAALFLLTACLLARRGADCLFMWSYPVMLAAGVLLFLSVGVTLPDWETRFLEVPQAAPFLRECISTLPGYLAVLLPARLAGDAKAPARGILLGGVFLSLLSLRTLLLLGGAVYPYPSYAAAGLAAVGDFLRRCEVVFGAVLVICECTRVAACFSFLRTAAPRKVAARR